MILKGFHRKIFSILSRNYQPASILFKYSKEECVLTQHSHSVVRNPKFAKLAAEDIRAFASILQVQSPFEENPFIILPGQNNYSGFNQDWQKKFRGNAACILRPNKVEQISSILRYCNEKSLAVVPQSGNTGLVGGSVPVFDEIILSMSLLNKILSFDHISGILHCEAGCILENLETYVNERGFTMPLDLGSKGSCQIGGNLATNAGGIKLLRYFGLHANTLGLEVVLADGTIMELSKGLRKDNTGYHSHMLFVGSEGTLGVISKCHILVPPLPSSVQLLFLGCSSFQNVLQVFSAAKGKYLNEILSACEFLDHGSLSLVEKHLGKKNQPGENRDFLNPLQEKCPFYVIIETSGSCSEHDSEKVLKFTEYLKRENIVLDGIYCSNTNQMKKIWKIRESVSLALRKDGHVFKYDVSVPIEKLYDPVLEIQSVIQQSPHQATSVVGYGHLGDGNLHLNITVEENLVSRMTQMIEPFLFDFISQSRGSISAEHGIGFQKRKYLKYSKSPEAIKWMTQLKDSLDPKGILNPYKLLG